MFIGEIKPVTAKEVSAAVLEKQLPPEKVVLSIAEQVEGQAVTVAFETATERAARADAPADQGIVQSVAEPQAEAVEPGEEKKTFSQWLKSTSGISTLAMVLGTGISILKR